MDKVNYFVCSGDYQNAKKELLKYFSLRKAKHLSSAEPLTEKDKNFPLAYIARHGVLSGPNEADVYLSSMFLSKSDDYTSLDIMPFLKESSADGFKSTLSFMIMSRQKEKACAYFSSPSSSTPPYAILKTEDGEEIKLAPAKYAYISSKAPASALSGESVYEICEESDSDAEAFGSGTGRIYLSFDFSSFDMSKIISARFAAKITLQDNINTKELLFFNISDSSWDDSLTWESLKGNVYSWESSPTGPFWESVPCSDAEYLNVICRFWFARPMAYQYLSDVEKNAIYGEKLLFLMDAFSKKKPGGFNRVLETGERLSNFACVLNALIDTPVMTADYLISILWIMYRDIKSLCENPDLGWSNWAVVRTSGLSKALDFLPELKMHEEWKNQTRDTLNSLFDKMYSPDFSFREAGLAYSFWCTDLFASAVNSAHINNDPYSAFMRSRIEKAFDASLDLIYPNFYDTNIGDSNYQSKRDYLSKVGSQFPTKKLKAFLSGKDDPSVPTSVHYPYGGSVIMRNSFNKETGLYLAMHSIPFDGHAHDDLASIVLYGYGRVLLTDSGRYGYSKSEISSFLKTASAHNCIEVDGYAAAAHSMSNAKITTFVAGAAFDYAECTQNPYKDIDLLHKRRVLFVKNAGFTIVSDLVTTDGVAAKFNQNWHFMPDANPYCDDNSVKTQFAEGGNIKLVCPEALLSEISDSIFSSGYGMAEANHRATFTKYGQNASFTTLLLPYNGEEPRVSAASLTPEDLSYSSAVFDIDSSRGVFYAKNTCEGTFLDCSFDGEAAFLLNGRMYLTGGKKLTVNGVGIIDSPSPIKEMYIHISGGIIEIESLSVTKCTKREEAIKIYAPKTTHVLVNGESVPFSVYSDCVYAVAPM